jgi:hypothetical protein
MYNSDITLQLILHKLREDLLKYRKCFSGAQLVNWVMKNLDLVFATFFFSQSLFSIVLDNNREGFTHKCGQRFSAVKS